MWLAYAFMLLGVDVTLPLMQAMSPTWARSPCDLATPLVSLGQRVHSKPIEKAMVPPIKEPKTKDPQVSGEPGSEPSSLEPKLDLQPEPTVKFLFTLLSAVEPPEPKDPEEDWEIQESRFLDKQDWGAKQTSKEISCLQNACMRLRESLSTIQAENLALGQKLENLPNLLYTKLKKEVKAIQEEGKPVQEGAQDIQEKALIQVLRQACGEW